jgi:hypothetical protein
LSKPILEELPLTPKGGDCAVLRSLGLGAGFDLVIRDYFGQEVTTIHLDPLKAAVVSDFICQHMQVGA